MTRRDTLFYAVAGLGVWLNGAVTFRLGGRILFAHGPAVTVLVAIVIAVLVCMALRLAMGLRKARAADAVTIAVIMALPGLFGETLRQIAFSWATGLDVATAPAFAATILFGNAVLLTYATTVARRADA
jgi:hypothetical protein